MEKRKRNTTQRMTTMNGGKAEDGSKLGGDGPAQRHSGRDNAGTGEGPTKQKPKGDDERVDKGGAETKAKAKAKVKNEPNAKAKAKTKEKQVA